VPVQTAGTGGTASCAVPPVPCSITRRNVWTKAYLNASFTFSAAS
jgi:hypothetical protein